MMLTDNETVVDLLNNEAIANTIINMISENPEQPITVGVHGDWGAGKSSIMMMIEDKLSSDENTVCVKFNGWRFQGFGDAKVTIIEGIVTELLKNRPSLTKFGDTIRNIYKRISWMKLARLGTNFAINVATGLPTFDQVNALRGLNDRSSEDGDTSEKSSTAGNSLNILDENSKNVVEEIDEFHKEFDTLLKKANIYQLVVLIDDLDRCLPHVVIESLEAIRLFLFTKRTAFVIAADEELVEYSVRRHFPQQMGSSLPKDYARNYLEKLIQIPFRIPALGETETRIYVTLLLIGSKLEEGNRNFRQLIEKSREMLKQPWKSVGLNAEIVKTVLTSDFELIKNELTLSEQISPILAKGTNGNPRQIKRFLNALILRNNIANARGFEEFVKLPVLAKLMLVEQFQKRIFAQIAKSASNNEHGYCLELGRFEKVIAEYEGDEPNKKTRKKQSKSTSKLKENQDLSTEEWTVDEEFENWVRLKPSLSNIDLRPYLFVTKEYRDFGRSDPISNDLLDLVDNLFLPELSIQNYLGKIEKLTDKEASIVFETISDRIIQSGELMSKPAGIDGLVQLVREHKFLQPSLLDFLERIPTERCGVWITGGWNNVITGAIEKERFRKLLIQWSESENLQLKKAASHRLTTRRSA